MWFDIIEVQEKSWGRWLYAFLVHLNLLNFAENGQFFVYVALNSLIKQNLLMGILTNTCFFDIILQHFPFCHFQFFLQLPLFHRHLVFQYPLYCLLPAQNLNQ